MWHTKELSKLKERKLEDSSGMGELYRMLKHGVMEKR